MDVQDLTNVAIPDGCLPVNQIAIRKRNTGEIVSLVPVQDSSDARLCIVIAENIRQSLRPDFYVDYP